MGAQGCAAPGWRCCWLSSASSELAAQPSDVGETDRDWGPPLSARHYPPWYWGTRSGYLSRSVWGFRSKFVFQALNVNLAAARRAQVDGRSSASSGAFDVARGASRHTPGARACACRLRRASSLPIFFFGCPLPDAENPPLLSRASTTQDPQCLAVVGILSNLSSWHLSNVMVIVFK